MDRLRKRRDFLAAAKAERASVPSFLLQGRDRRDEAEPRLGFTVTKKNGNAVVRNRMRRRLREAARQVLPQTGRNGFDYVLVARSPCLKAPFQTLVRDLERAVARLHAAKKSKDSSAPADGGRPA
ncbi:ribonuclease P protein component [Azorhizobium doebereinerae]|uniref:ribonuclease P protein component n=1 Tax=Azorhizobium doebereinerae TaxID=281091 RepID=UPI0003FAF10C|nr:ribonuclease P protein component [Azorhizobium doebereinerae]